MECGELNQVSIRVMGSKGERETVSWKKTWVVQLCQDVDQGLEGAEKLSEN